MSPSWTATTRSTASTACANMIRRKTGGADGVYFTYTEEKPISFNPFYTDDYVFDVEKKDSIKTLLLTLWKSEDDKVTKTESGELGSAVNAYIERIRANRSIVPSFNTFYEYMRDDYRRELAEREIKVEKSDFNIDNMLTTMFDREIAGTEDGTDFDLANPGGKEERAKPATPQTIQSSAAAYRDLNATLGNFYEQPKNDNAEMDELLERIASLESELESEKGKASSMDEQVALMEKSYELAAKYMPVPNKVTKGQTVEIRCELKKEGDFANTLYTIRYFQFEGEGKLKMDNGITFLPNDRYLLENGKFRLYYTAEGDEAHNFIVVVEDNFGNSFELEFDFNNRNVKDDGLTIVPIGNFRPLLK